MHNRKIQYIFVTSIRHNTIKVTTMTIQNFFETARWAESMLNEEKENCSKFTGFARQNAVKNYYYLVEWLDTFNRLSTYLNWNDEHIIYQEGISKLINHCNNL